MTGTLGMAELSPFAWRKVGVQEAEPCRGIAPYLGQSSGEDKKGSFTGRPAIATSTTVSVGGDLSTLKATTVSVRLSSHPERGLPEQRDAFVTLFCLSTQLPPG